MSIENKQAFLESIEKTHGQQLRRFLSSRLRNAAADMPDPMQEVYLRLLRIDDHDAIRNPQAYLYTVASHVLHQYALRSSQLGAETTKQWVDCKSMTYCGTEQRETVPLGLVLMPLLP